jgi:indole-3-glycerol phosphate synthase
MKAPNVLKKIAAYKAREVEVLKSQTSIEALRKIAANGPAPRGFMAALKSSSEPALITEVKKASPSKGTIREDFDPAAIAKAYEAGGASCLSVLTDGPGFQGSPEIFQQVRRACSLPLLRKDFLLEPIQIAESAAMGADCVLVIMAMIDDAAAAALMEEARVLHLDVLVETHDAAEMARAAALGAEMIGINNRDLRTFETSLQTFQTLAPIAPKNAFLVAESGIFTRADIKTLAAAGAQSFLIGESLMRAKDIEAATQDLRGT